MVILVMGVAGSGKTTVGQMLSTQLNWPFVDGDSLHSPANIAKMAAGIPLTDEDRIPWLRSIHAVIQSWLDQGKGGIVASSALKEGYRRMLVTSADIKLVYLRGTYDVIFSRLQHRAGHYMKPEMLRSQFEALEEPKDALIVDIAQPAEHIVSSIRGSLAI